MRRIGGELTREQAERFASYLFTRDIQTATETAADGQYEVWVKDEDRLQEARSELDQFLSNPNDPRYRVERQAVELRRRREKEQREKKKLQQHFQPRRTAGSSTSLVVLLIIACVIVTLLTNFGKPTRGQVYRADGEIPWAVKLYNQLTLVPMFVAHDELEPGENVHPLSWAIMRGQIWRLVTPLLLHGSVLHLLFNCLMLYQLGRILEMIRGPWFMLVLFLIGGIVGMFAQAYMPVSLGGSMRVIGASGGVLALFTYLWLRPMVEPELPFRMPPFSVAIIFGFVLLGMVPGFLPGIANFAHLGGIGVGALAAASGLLEPLRR